MTRVDKFALAGGIITGLTLYTLWRNRDTAAAFGEALAPRPARKDHMASCIWIDPGRQSGAPCFGGTRVPVATVANLPDDTIADWYPGVTAEHVKTMRWWLEQPGVYAMLRRSTR